MLKEQKKYDIAVIGGGLAGLSAACEASKYGNLKIALIERAGIGSNNPSPLTFTDVVQEFELETCVKGKISQFAFHNYQGSCVQYIFKKYPFVVLDYKKACQTIYSQFLERVKEYEYYEDEVQEIGQSGGDILIKMKGSQTICTRILIDASGKSQLVSEQVLKKSSSYYSHVYGGIFSIDPQKDDSVGYFLWPYKEFGTGGGWYYPLEEDRTSFGYASIARERKSDIKTLENRFWMAVKDFSPYNAILAKAKLEAVEFGSIPITFSEKISFDNILIAGDAAGMATNWTCMGVEPALRYGRLAGETAARAIKENRMKLLKEYQKIWDSDNRKTYEKVARFAEKFWNANHEFWEWINKNDLAFLSPHKIVGRMRKNEHQMSLGTILLRGLINRCKSIWRRNHPAIEHIYIR